MALLQEENVPICRLVMYIQQFSMARAMKYDDGHFYYLRGRRDPEIHSLRHGTEGEVFLHRPGGAVVGWGWGHRCPGLRPSGPGPGGGPQKAVRRHLVWQADVEK